MDPGTAWALVWVVSLVIFVVIIGFGEGTVNSSPIGVSYAIATIVLVISTVVCVWIASGLHISLTKGG